jgi:hypothetical protein
MSVAGWKAEIAALTGGNAGSDGADDTGNGKE